MTVAILLSGLEYDRQLLFLKEFNPKRVYILVNTKIITNYNEEIQQKVNENVKLLKEFLDKNPFMEVHVVKVDYFEPYAVFEELLRIMREEVERRKEEVKVCVVGGLTPLRIYAHLAASVFYPNVQTIYVYGKEYYPPLKEPPYQLVKGVWRLEIIPPIPLMNFRRLDRYERGILIALLEAEGVIKTAPRKRTAELLKRLVELGFISSEEAKTRSASTRVGQALRKLEALKFVKAGAETGTCELTESGKLAATICKVLAEKMN